MKYNFVWIVYPATKNNKMSKNYEEIKDYLEGIDMKLVSSVDDYSALKKIAFECSKGHVNDMRVDSFTKKRGKFAKESLPMDAFCSKCVPGSMVHYKRTRDYLESIGMKLVSSIDDYVNSNKIVFECPASHVSTLKVRAFHGKRCEYSRLYLSTERFCAKCRTDIISDPVKSKTIPRYNKLDISPKKSRRFVNLENYLRSIGFGLLTPYYEYENTKRIAFECPNGHTSSMTFDCFVNKKAKFKSTPGKLCSHCKVVVHIDKNKKSLEELQAILPTGHVLLEWISAHDIRYRCGKCGAENSSGKSNLLKQTVTRCGHCCNRKDILDVKSEVEKLGFTLLTRPEEYKSNKYISVLCPCGSAWENVSLNDIRRGRRCRNCKSGRTARTNRQKYGVDNVFQSEMIKEKSKQTSIEKYGVEHPSKHPDVQKKKEDTCMTNNGVQWFFTKPEIYERIRATHKQKYGVEYPLQSDEIQRKIDETFLRKTGARRPMLSKMFRQLILERYGNEIYVKTDDYKKKMVDSYGNEIYVKTDDYKKKMVDSYGNECPMRCPELFRKASSTSFLRKSYKYGGRVWMVRGYEDRCLDVLLKDEGVSPDDIIGDENDEMPLFRYDCGVCDKCSRGNLHMYYPDFYIEKQNRIIEVKSVYTFQRDIEKIQKKLKAVIDAGYRCEVWIFDRKELLGKCDIQDKNCIDAVVDKYKGSY